jgi:hypothetical protein
VEQASGTTPTGAGAANPEQDRPADAAADGEPVSAAASGTSAPGGEAVQGSAETTATPAGPVESSGAASADAATASPSGTPVAAPSTPGFRSRGRARRRARFLRRARELAYRDLGGLVFNLHRFGQRNDPLVVAKLNTLAHLDGELHAVEALLRERHPITVLREAGITACPRCAAIHSSEDKFCPNCGLPVDRHVDLPAGFQSSGAGPQAPAPAAPASQPGGPGPLPAEPVPSAARESDSPTEILRPQAKTP